MLDTTVCSVKLCHMASVLLVQGVTPIQAVMYGGKLEIVAAPTGQNSDLMSVVSMSLTWNCPGCG